MHASRKPGSRHRPFLTYRSVATTGDADYHLRVVVSDMAAYNRFLDDFMFKLPGIRHFRTNVILKEIKYDVALPF
jgi:Lrp/AsnC family leucine-responsive transcriptional regulator